MYEDFFYWINQFLVRLNRSKTPASDAILLLLMIQAENIFTFLMVVHNIKYIHIDDDIAIGIGLLMFLILFFLNQTFLFKRKEIIFAKIEDYSDQKRNRSLITFWFYLLLSIGSFIVIGAYSDATNVNPVVKKSDRRFF